MLNQTENIVTMEELIPLIQESLSVGQSVRLSPRGVSMLPMLRQGIDSVVLSPISGRLKKYDLPLYRRDDGKYVLHRIIAVGDTYTCIGDNQFMEEKGIRQDQIIAVVTAFYRGEKFWDTKDSAYQLYCRGWHYSRSFRRVCKRGTNWLRRHLK